ncbi:hypothetical protein WANA31_1195 [Wolbachia endosymbiont of Drosophila ananassae]|nr:hypothetical protein WANA31_1195 [Wolbachia endosymbiont of Drosophila ananassae]RLT60454.1 hypothetical protein WANA13_0188 [Wolbachia endosymbiont of Drosophila ananassae]RLT62532.1 hypothetical protein WANA34_1226 [Wolbachia endosymbiont of Drosophila ananassae]
MSGHWDDKKEATWMIPIALSFQRVTLESSSYYISRDLLY